MGSKSTTNSITGDVGERGGEARKMSNVRSVYSAPDLVRYQL